MAPSKASRNHDDPKSEAGTAKDKNGGSSSAKMRRGASQQGGSNLREVTNASATAAQPSAAQAAPSLQWSTFERDMLHAYSREYNLNTASSFTSTYHQTILSKPGSIGAFSPTMLRRKKQRQNKEQLTRAVRKHFNGLGIQENDVIVDFIYKIRTDNAAKMRGQQKPSVIPE